MPTGGFLFLHFQYNPEFCVFVFFFIVQNFLVFFRPFIPRKYLYIFYLLSGCSHSWAQQPFHQFFLQHDGIHPKMFRHWWTKIADGSQKNNPAGNGTKKANVKARGRDKISHCRLCLCSFSPFVPPLWLVLIHFLLFSSCPWTFFPSFLSPSQLPNPPCSDRYGGILTEREGDWERESERGGNLWEETSEGWETPTPKRNSFIRPVFPPPARAERKIKLSTARNDEHRERTDWSGFVDPSVERWGTDRSLFELGSVKSCSDTRQQTDQDTNSAGSGLHGEITRLTRKLTCWSKCSGNDLTRVTCDISPQQVPTNVLLKSSSDKFRGEITLGRFCIVVFFFLEWWLILRHRQDAQMQNVYCSSQLRLVFWWLFGFSLVLLQFLGIQSYPLITMCGRWLPYSNNIYHNESLFHPDGAVTTVKHIMTLYSGFAIFTQKRKRKIEYQSIARLKFEIYL